MQRHVEDPMLVGGRKFHLRVHALAISDLQVRVHAACLALPATARYDPKDLDNKFAHATNHCVQKHHPGRAAVGGSLTLEELAKLVHPQ
eukprot:2833437-Pyramimonas_sp.AAC.1